MSREEILERVNRVFKDVFDDEDVAVTFTSTAADVEGWDSLRHITLIEAVEDEFDMRFQMNEVTGMKDVGEMVDIIAERVK
ncbi:MAG: acyl carrier protein [Lachnospiraceae bacterium]|nr:acyl carrier protein [Lachnospiraceae bacterium]